MKFIKRIVVIGAGPSGLSVAWGLAANKDIHVTLLEYSHEIGGLSRTLDYNGIRFDIGPHRLSAQLPEMLEAVRNLFGDKLIEKENHHAVYINGVLYRYPPKLRDFLNLNSIYNTLRFGSSWLLARFKSVCLLFAKLPQEQTFAGILQNSFGNKFCEAVIFPMIKKVWGTLDLHVDFARIRFQLPTLTSFICRIFSKRAKLLSRYFYYPVSGFGDIWIRIGEQLLSHGQTIELPVRITRIEAATLHGPFVVSYMKEGIAKQIEADIVVSTISNQDLLRYIASIPEASQVTNEIDCFESRTLRLGIVLVKNFHLAQRVIIFPEKSFIFNRISEMNQFADLGNPIDQTILMVDVIVDKQDFYFNAPDEKFNEDLLAAVLALGWFSASDVTNIFSIRVPNAYPVLNRRRYEAQERLTSFFMGTNIILCGREASSDYNNAHNAIAKGFLAAKLIQGEITASDYLEVANIVGRLPIQD